MLDGRVEPHVIGIQQVRH